MKLRRLTDSGIQSFTNWLDMVRADCPLPAPLELLLDASHSAPLEFEVAVDNKSFTTRIEAASYLLSLLDPVPLTSPETDRGLWAWLSLLFIDSVCPLNKDGSRKPGETARHIPEPGNFRKYYRHLLAGPYRILKAHRDNPDRALCLLCQPLHTPGDVVETIASRQERVSNVAILELATKLYVDKQLGKLKRGAGGKSAGSPRRLSDVLDQLDLTWDLYATTGEELALMMPAEFKRFLK
jgi:hypothetical protein